MSLTEYLSVPFLISLGITLLLVGIIGMFFTQRLQEQNHKINSIVGLVTTMAEEMNYLRGRISNMNPDKNQKEGESILGLGLGFESGLVLVSDGEDDSDDSDDESDDDSDDDKDFENSNVQDVKLINISNNSPDDQMDFTIDDDDIESENSDSNSESSESLNLVEVDSNVDLNALNISLTNLNDTHYDINLDVVDYKKLSLNKLRSIAYEKGLSEDPTKLKKPELLKLLEQ